MKARLGFVSNSSSASFVVKFTSDHPREEIDKHIRLMFNGFEWNKNKKLDLSEKDGVYFFLSETNMFNDWYDIIEWPFIKMLSSVDPGLSGYHLVEIRQTEAEYDSCDRVVNFDPEPWDACYVEHREPEDTDDTYNEKVKEYEERMFQYEGQFLSFLYAMDLPIDNKLLLLDYKYSK